MRGSPRTWAEGHHHRREPNRERGDTTGRGLVPTGLHPKCVVELPLPSEQRSAVAQRMGELGVRAYVRDVVESSRGERQPPDKAERRAARELVAAYHQDELRKLLEHVRDGF